jgi:L-threonate 2-dehydrogenase
MGGAMAARLLAAGHAVAGFDVNAYAIVQLVAGGGEAAGGPASAARGAEVLLVMVHDAAQVEQVLFGPARSDHGDAGPHAGRLGAVDALSPGCVVWLASTVPPAYAAELGQRLAARGVDFIDGPVSGGTTGADDGQLVAICGATAQAMDGADFALRACTHRIHRVGMPGAGSTVKMINQLLVAAHSALACEAMALAMRAGVDPLQVIDVIAESAGSSRMFEKRAPRIAAGDHAVHASIDTLRKDLGIAIRAAEQVGVEPVIGRCVQGLLDAASGSGHGAESDTSLVRHFLTARTDREDLR